VSLSRPDVADSSPGRQRVKCLALNGHYAAQHDSEGALSRMSARKPFLLTVVPLTIGAKFWVKPLILRPLRKGARCNMFHVKVKYYLDIMFCGYSGPMYIETVPIATLPGHPPREGWREGHKTHKRTLANLSTGRSQDRDLPACCATRPGLSARFVHDSQTLPTATWNHLSLVRKLHLDSMIASNPAEGIWCWR